MENKIFKNQYSQLSLDKINNDIAFLDEHITHLELFKWDGFMFSNWKDSEFIEDMGEGLTILSIFTILPLSLLAFVNPGFLVFSLPTIVLGQYTYNPIPELISASKAPFERLKIFNLKRKRKKFIKAKQVKIEQEKEMDELLFEKPIEQPKKYSQKLELEDNGNNLIKSTTSTKTEEALTLGR